MPDGIQAQGGRVAAQKVTLGRESDVERWCAQLRCTEAQLQRAVKAVGSNPSRIEEHLMRKYGAAANWRDPGA